MTETSTQFASVEVASDDLNLVHASKNGDVTAFRATRNAVRSQTLPNRSKHYA